MRPACAPRHSFTLWYYDALEKAEAMAAQRVAGMAGGAGEAVQKEAQQLLRDILAQVCLGRHCGGRAWVVRGGGRDQGAAAAREIVVNP